MSLALSTLLYEWRRYTAAFVALAFSGLLVLAMSGMFMGMGKSFTAAIDRSAADIMVLGPNAKQLFDSGSGVPRRIMPTIYTHPAIVAVDYIDMSGGRFQAVVGPNERARTEFVQVNSVVTTPGNPTIPSDYSEELIEALRQPYTIAVDESALRRLGVKLGDKAIYNGRTVTVAGVTRGYPNFMQANLVMSRDTLRMLGEAYNGDRVGPLMITIADPSQAEVVVAQLNAQANGQYRAWTRAALSRAGDTAMLEAGIVVVMLGFSLFLATLIGIAITSQTLNGAILANIKEFASLRALGVSMGSLRRVVIELSFWVGVTGVLGAGLLTWAISMLALAFGLPMSFPVWVILGVSAVLVTIAMLSGLMSLGVLKKSQPADLLR